MERNGGGGRAPLWKAVTPPKGLRGVPELPRAAQGRGVGGGPAQVLGAKGCNICSFLPVGLILGRQGAPKEEIKQPCLALPVGSLLKV